MNTEDIRWEQRLHNFCKAFAQLDEAVALVQVRELSRLEKQGVIQAFEYTYELAWNTLKKFLILQGMRRHYRLTGYYPRSLQQGAH
ncbi:nucleotidyltransferase substrate binding protein [Pseudomonas fluorescens]|uniref:nucleotidyltransferase substrate binding protein n=1 Tax=Pseudomonas fluorescens TaxID=294 RepID=UPI002181F12A|nr:nucleotidyltransferase substrate binding protein [Pseudomonas fluorescens]